MFFFSFSFQYRYRYQFKCRSDNAPHIFSVADAAYQDMLHHEQPQHILMAGETKSGKSLNYGKLIEHLLFLGEVCCSRYFARKSKLINGLYIWSGEKHLIV